MNNLRNDFTYISYVTVFVVTFFFFWYIDDPIEEFRMIVYTTAFMGVLCSLYFLWKIDEPKLTAACIRKQRKLEGKSSVSGSPKKSLNRTGNSSWFWFKRPMFYWYGFVYLGSKVQVAVSGT